MNSFKETTLLLSAGSFAHLNPDKDSIFILDFETEEIDIYDPADASNIISTNTYYHTKLYRFDL